MGMKEDLKNNISECTICQKIKWKRPNSSIIICIVSHLSELSNDTLDPLTEDEWGNVCQGSDYKSKIFGDCQQTNTIQAAEGYGFGENRVVGSSGS